MSSQQEPSLKLPENVSILFAKIIDLSLLTQKNHKLYGVIDEILHCGKIYGSG